MRSFYQLLHLRLDIVQGFELGWAHHRWRHTSLWSRVKLCTSLFGLMKLLSGSLLISLLAAVDDYGVFRSS